MSLRDFAVLRAALRRMADRLALSARRFEKLVFVFQFCNTAEILFLNLCNKAKIEAQPAAFKSEKSQKRFQFLVFVMCAWLN
jgi:hypothetical protein